MPTPTEIRKLKSVRFEVRNPKGGAMKFIVSRSEPNEKHPEPAFFLASLDGGFQYVGQINPADGRLVLTGSSRFNEADPLVKVARFALAVMFGSKELPAGFEILGPAPKRKKKTKKKTAEPENARLPL